MRTGAWERGAEPSVSEAGEHMTPWLIIGSVMLVGIIILLLTHRK